MCNRSYSMRVMFSVLLLHSLAGFAQGQGGAGHLLGQNVEEMKFGPVPGVPPCSTGSVQDGNPAKGPSIILAKAETGCVVPLHWHTPNEHLMMVTGEARLSMKDGKSFMLRAGGHALMPAQHVHRFLCVSSCMFYVYSDAAFDIHYVDAQGKEISPDDALKADEANVSKDAY